MFHLPQTRYGSLPEGMILTIIPEIARSIRVCAVTGWPCHLPCHCWAFLKMAIVAWPHAAARQLRLPNTRELNNPTANKCVLSTFNVPVFHSHVFMLAGLILKGTWHQLCTITLISFPSWAHVYIRTRKVITIALEVLRGERGIFCLLIIHLSGRSNLLSSSERLRAKSDAGLVQRA